VMEDGRIAFAGEPLPIDESFIAIAKEGRNPRKRFRFVDVCFGHKCPHWSDGRCDVADAAVEELTPSVPEDGLPECGIRSSCRWYHQRGSSACCVCPQIITERLRED
jgi:hypothetical protein